MQGPVTDQGRAAEGRELHYERWQWGGRPPSQTLRRVRGSNVLGLVTFDSELVHALDAAGPQVQRAAALLAARRACETAGLTDVSWVAQALIALDERRPLPPPFDNAAQMWRALGSTPLTPGPPVLMAMPPERPPYFPPTPTGWAWIPIAQPRGDGAKEYELGRTPGTGDAKSAIPADLRHHGAILLFPVGAPQVPEAISQPHFALPAVLAAAELSPLHAALDAVWHAVHTYGEHYPELLEEIRSICAKGADE
ncbi:hypothetical protein ABT246_40735 [Streptomyces sp. NPDC001553]|uniref:hypothetical protein n=1 Tax=Streptomyces sp. NPDC001553 TaxID=3154385 RepID=UPI00331B40E1